MSRKIAKRNPSIEAASEASSKTAKVAKLKPFRVGVGSFLLASIALIGPLPRQNHATARQEVLDRNPKINRLLHQSCANCHSNATNWPWYAHIRPVSLLLSDDIRTARQYLRLSGKADLNASQRAEIYAAAASRLMPPKEYLFLHPEAKLSTQDLAVLARWAKSRDEDPHKEALANLQNQSVIGSELQLGNSFHHTRGTNR
jgi:hypothetical protein